MLTADGGTFNFGLSLPGMNRPLAAQEMSDGTLRFLYLAAALLTPRPPELLVLNEPETSLHPRLLEPLAALVVGAARFAQVMLTTHSDELASLISQATGQPSVVLTRGRDGATRVES